MRVTQTTSLFLFFSEQDNSKRWRKLASIAPSNAAPVRVRNRINFRSGSRIAIMHGCVEVRAAQQAGSPN
jgi:hypothetical protein